MHLLAFGVAYCFGYMNFKITDSESPCLMVFILVVGGRRCCLFAIVFL